ncbi:MAG: biotin--[acetyl-CoA-carboxylase] ligase [Chlamydiales bacterium]|nr:biotin--[acetyl-CoA-carboxylase] ligase [Chlamydiales bacterium]
MSQIEFLHFPSLPSTNDYAKEQLNSWDKSKTYVVHADKQTKGRGQFNRSWDSPEGNLYFSYILFLPKLPKQLHLLGVASALIISQAINKQGINVKIKWPNDLFLSGKKCGGILCETASCDEHFHYIILGVGVNINASIPSELDKIACALSSFTSEKLLPTVVLKLLIDNLHQKLPLFISDGFKFLSKDFKHLFLPSNKVYHFNNKGKKISGKILEIDLEGDFIIQDVDNKIFSISSPPHF